MAKGKAQLPALEAGPVPLVQIRCLLTALCCWVCVCLQQLMLHLPQLCSLSAVQSYACDVLLCYSCCRNYAKKQLVDIIDSVSGTTCSTAQQYLYSRVLSTSCNRTIPRTSMSTVASVSSTKPKTGTSGGV